MPRAASARAEALKYPVRRSWRTAHSSSQTASTACLPRIGWVKVLLPALEVLNLVEHHKATALWVVRALPLEQVRNRDSDRPV
jgi:hypothetical protein